MGDHLQSGLPCTNCSSSDAMAEYDDAYYCFSCHKYTQKKGLKKNRMYNQKRICSFDIKELENDYYNFLHLPEIAKDYLHKYHFTDELIKRYKIGWSDNLILYNYNKDFYQHFGPRLLIPCFNPFSVDGDRLKLQYAECKSITGENPKYVVVGSKTKVFTAIKPPPLYESKSTLSLVIVEDMLSAMRVSQVSDCVALRGTHLKPEDLVTFADLSETIFVWLDGDRPGRQAAKKIIKTLSLYCKPHFVKTKEDPKHYRYEDIEALIEGAMDV